MKSKAVIIFSIQFNDHIIVCIISFKVPTYLILSEEPFLLTKQSVVVFTVFECFEMRHQSGHVLSA